ncbi:hypothetical protein TRFO_12180 [Tritrichomonas foetus]|uniref:Leucine Rich Repeat family protein n=1 Tax=Tritrichomonas foetus TaxID=1144522 RepID=A0A1J4J2M5_9EUKA|nr:hypothetical protein TRFO_12180 [Tritrichomonas foetus]|eukprot:OHS92985.1 hypothetical protein TRFO_12180 [Tritrichomonas foetus]
MQTEKPIIYKYKHMYELGNGDMVSCNFDFSALSTDDYQGFFNGLPQLLYKKVKSVRFCNDAYKKLENNHNATDEQLREMEYTIKGSNPNYFKYLAKIIWTVLPRAKLLYSLTIDGIPIHHDDFTKIVDSLRKCKSIRQISIVNTTVNRDDFIYFIDNVSPYRLEKIEFPNCHLTSDVYDTVCEFLNRQPPSSGNEWKLKILNLEGNGLTPDNFDVIEAMMQKKAHPNDSDDQTTITTGDEIQPFGKANNKDSSSSDDFSDGLKERKADLSSDDEEDEDYSDSDKKNTKEFKLGTPTAINKSRSQIALENIQKAAATVKPASPTNDLRRQNANLKRELQELLQKVNAVKYNDDVFLIGEGSADNLASIREVEEMIRDYEAEHGEIKI